MSSLIKVRIRPLAKGKVPEGDKEKAETPVTIVIKTTPKTKADKGATPKEASLTYSGRMYVTIVGPAKEIPKGENILHNVEVAANGDKTIVVVGNIKTLEEVTKACAKMGAKEGKGPNVFPPATDPKPTNKNQPEASFVKEKPEEFVKNLQAAWGGVGVQQDGNQGGKPDGQQAGKQDGLQTALPEGEPDVVKIAASQKLVNQIGTMSDSVPQIYSRCPTAANVSEGRDELVLDDKKIGKTQGGIIRAMGPPDAGAVVPENYFRYFDELLLLEEAESRTKELYTWPDPLGFLGVTPGGAPFEGKGREMQRRFRAVLFLPHPKMPTGGEFDRVKRGQQLVLLPQKELEELRKCSVGHFTSDQTFVAVPDPSETGFIICDRSEVIEAAVVDVVGVNNAAGCSDGRVKITIQVVLPADGPRELPVSFVSRTSSDASAAAMRKAMKMLIDEDRKLALSDYILRKKSNDEPAIAAGVLSTSALDVWTDCPDVKVNASQREAAKVALCGADPIALIQGPPGTGKTTTSAFIIATAVRAGHRVIACGHSNAAVDNLCEKILQFQDDSGYTFPVFRYESATRIKHFSKSEGGDASVSQKNKKMERILPTVHNEVMEIIRDQLTANYQEAELSVLCQAQVLCCTCSGASDAAVRRAAEKSRKGWPIVLMDEATQVYEPMALIPLLVGMKRLVMVGDPRQLGPVIKSNDQNKKKQQQQQQQQQHPPAVAGGDYAPPQPAEVLDFRETQPPHEHLGLSLFERLCVEEKRPMLMLNTQYRMNPHLAQFSSNRYYNGKLQSGVTCEQRTPTSAIPWNWQGCVYFHDTGFGSGLKGQEEQPERGRYLNKVEAVQVVILVRRLIEDGQVPASAIGVMTPYDGQRNELRRLLHPPAPTENMATDDSDEADDNGTESKSKVKDEEEPWFAPRVEIDSIDAFQGREKEYIVFSTVRTERAGFLDDERRMNVAITRAKRGLIVLGDKNFFQLRTHQLSVWRSFMGMLMPPYFNRNSNAPHQFVPNGTIAGGHADSSNQQTVHPCLRVHRQCFSDPNCIWANFPFNSCLSFLKRGKCELGGPSGGCKLQHITKWDSRFALRPPNVVGPGWGTNVEARNDGWESLASLNRSAPDDGWGDEDGATVGQKREHGGGGGNTEATAPPTKKQRREE